MAYYSHIHIDIVTLASLFLRRVFCHLAVMIEIKIVSPTTTGRFHFDKKDLSKQ